MAVMKEGSTSGNSIGWSVQAWGGKATHQREPGTPKTEFGHFHVKVQGCWHQLRLLYARGVPAEMSNEQRHQKTAPLHVHGPEAFPNAWLLGPGHT